MGYDCTLHLVDEKAIREEFVPRLLRRSRKKTALDRVLPDAAELWTTARKALDRDDPDTAASMICQLAVMFSACSLPHQYERGFALPRESAGGMRSRRRPIKAWMAIRARRFTDPARESLDGNG